MDDFCTGTGPDCPADAKSTAECRSTAGPCDDEERCDGVHDECPEDEFKPATTVCRPAAGECDIAETCTGAGPDCPADAKSTAECRSAAGPCDDDERCDGVHDDCPEDEFKPATTVCRAAAGDCDIAERCTGTRSDCPADAKSTAVCRSSAGPCDDAELCDGVHNGCPADGFKPATTGCRPAAGDCDIAETCTGTRPDCPGDTKSTAVCRPAAGPCDTPESCDGVHDDCPADAAEPQDACNDCGSAIDEPCAVTVTARNAAPRVFDDLQQAINSAPNGATITVRGRCAGPVSIVRRSNLTITGIAPADTPTGCPAEGLRPGDLSSTVTSASEDAIDVLMSTNIRVMFLNVVDAPSDGIEFRDASKGTAFCNCFARNFEGVELRGASSTVVQQNLVKDNVSDGILVQRMSKPATKNQINANTVVANGKDGIRVETLSTGNTFAANLLVGNADDGIELADSPRNKVTSNRAEANGDGGVQLRAATRNLVDKNMISGNGDGLVNILDCVSGSRNTGSNVSPACR